MFALIKEADTLDRLKTLIGKELTKENLHTAIFCEAKHQKNLRRFYVGTHTYIEYKLHVNETSGPSFANINILGNPYTYQVEVESIDGKYIIQTEARISFSYL